MSDRAIETQDLGKTSPGGITVVHDLDLAVVPGGVYGLIGRNGGGKTTALRLIMDLLRRDRGRALVGRPWAIGHFRARADIERESP